MLHPDIQAVLDSMHAAPGLPAHRVPVAQARAAHDLETAELSGPGQPVAEVLEVTAPGPSGPVPIRVFKPAGERQPGIVAYLHGGGWVLGSLAGFEPLCRALANASGAAVAAVDYRLAPEHPFPAGLEDALAAVRWLGAEGGRLGADPQRLALAGDSAGGNLAAVAARRLRDEQRRGAEASGRAPLRLQALVYPVCDSRPDTASYHENAEGFGLTAASMRRFWALYLDGADGAEPDASPLRARDLTGLPPTLVLTVRRDVLHDE